MKARRASKPVVLAGVAIVTAAVVVAGMAVFTLGPFSNQGPPVTTPLPPEVQIMNFSYSPTQLTVKAGSSVQWTNTDPVEHTVTVGGHGGGHVGSIDSGMMVQGQKFNYTFETPGTYEYHCDPHPTMMGTITVTA